MQLLYKWYNAQVRHDEPVLMSAATAGTTSNALPPGGQTKASRLMSCANEAQSIRITDTPQWFPTESTPTSPFYLLHTHTSQGRRCLGSDTDRRGRWCTCSGNPSRTSNSAVRTHSPSCLEKRRPGYWIRRVNDTLLSISELGVDIPDNQCSERRTSRMDWEFSV